MDEKNRERLSAGVSWGLLLIVILTLIACVSVAVDIYNNLPKR